MTFLEYLISKKSLLLPAFSLFLPKSIPSIYNHLKIVCSLNPCSLVLVFFRPLHSYGKISVSKYSLLTFCNTNITIVYMKILMDADCLIKITKCGLKHLLCQHFKIFISAKVKEEVVDKGIQKGCTDAFIVRDNIKKGLLTIIKHERAYNRGEQEIVALFKPSSYNAIA